MIVGDPLATVVSAIRGVPDLIFWPVFFVATWIVARGVVWLLTRDAGRGPSSDRLRAATTSGPHIPATAAFADSGPIIQNTGSGQIIVTLPGSTPRDTEDAKRLQEQEAQ